MLGGAGQSGRSILLTGPSGSCPSGYLANRIASSLFFGEGKILANFVESARNTIKFTGL